MLKKVEVKILDKRIGTVFPMPKFATDGSAAIDLINCSEDTVVLHSNNTAVLMPTGIAIHIKDSNYMAAIFPTFGLGHKSGIILSVGIVDSDYTGELKVSAWNRSNDPFIVHPGERFAQLIFMPIQRPVLVVVDEFTQKTARGDGGFGSTGNN